MQRWWVSLLVCFGIASLVGVVYQQYSLVQLRTRTPIITSTPLYTEKFMEDTAKSTLTQLVTGIEKKDAKLVEQYLDIAGLCKLYVTPIIKQLEQLGEVSSEASVDKILAGCYQDFLRSVAAGASQVGGTASTQYQSLLAMIDQKNSVALIQSNKNIIINIETQGGVQKIELEPLENRWRVAKVN